MTKNAFDSRRWVLPVVSLIPLMAIAFAFSLGPSPRKRLQVIYDSEKVDAAMLADLAAEAGPASFEAITEDVQLPGSPHREALIRFLGEQAYAPAGPVLRRLAMAPTERPAVRTAALRALKQLDPQGVRALAGDLKDAPDPVGRAARDLLAELSSGRS